MKKSVWVCVLILMIFFISVNFVSSLDDCSDVIGTECYTLDSNKDCNCRDTYNPDAYCSDVSCLCEEDTYQPWLFEWKCNNCNAPESCPGECTSHYETKCYNNHIYWYDSCGVREDIKTNCDTTCANQYSCKEGSPDSCCCALTCTAATEKATCGVDVGPSCGYTVCPAGTKGTKCTTGECIGGSCITLLANGKACTSNSYCSSGYCRTDWDGSGKFCASSSSTCVLDSNGDGDATDAGDSSSIANGYEQCVGSSYKTCGSSGTWSSSTTCAIGTEEQEGGNPNYCQYRTKSCVSGTSGGCSVSPWYDQNDELICSQTDYCLGDGFYSGKECTYGYCNVGYGYISCADASCSSDGDGTYSQKTDSTCSSASCTSQTTTSCNTGYACDEITTRSTGNACTTSGSCTSDNQCAEGYACEGGNCIVPCTDTCSSLGYNCGTRTVCGVSTNCGDCPTGEYCNTVRNECVECVNDDECPSGEVCDMDDSSPTFLTCGECASDIDCLWGVGEICQNQNCICPDDCVAYDDCETHTFCGVNKDCGGCPPDYACSSGTCKLDDGKICYSDDECASGACHSDWDGTPDYCVSGNSYCAYIGTSIVDTYRKCVEDDWRGCNSGGWTSLFTCNLKNEQNGGDPNYCQIQTQECISGIGEGCSFLDWVNQNQWGICSQTDYCSADGDAFYSGMSCYNGECNSGYGYISCADAGCFNDGDDTYTAKGDSVCSLTNPPCTTPTETDCGYYTCSGGACKTSCTTNADCASTYACDGGTCGICDLTSASWSVTNTRSGTVVTLTAGGSHCTGKSITFEIYKGDTLIKTLADKTYPSTTWTTTGWGTYYFKAKFAAEVATSGNLAVTACDDGTINGGEVCDDGATDNGLVCSPPYDGSCTYCKDDCSATVSVQGGYCDDGIVNGNEVCDNGATDNGVACTPAYGDECTYCSETCTSITLTGPYCGDDVINGAEACDGTTLGSCSQCDMETTIDAEKCVCAEYCGDDSVQSPNDNNVDEECDDGDTTSGDGCSGSCSWESEASWVDSSGSKIDVKAVIIDTTTINMLLRFSGLGEGSEVTFDVYEWDLITPDLVTTITTTVDSSYGGAAEESWLVTQIDLEKAAGFLEGELDAFYFIVNGEQSNDLDITFIEEDCSLINVCGDYLNEGECKDDAELCGVAKDSVPAEITCGDGYDCSCAWDDTVNPAICKPEYSEWGVCGDGIAPDAGGPCDGDNLGIFNGLDCAGPPQIDEYTGGPVTCTNCMFDPITCEGGIPGGICGDGEVNQGEICDGNPGDVTWDWGGITNCEDLGYDNSGTLKCYLPGEDDECNFDTFSSCTGGIDGETCIITQNIISDCDDDISGPINFLVYEWWTSCDPTKRTESTECPAQVQLPFFGFFGVVATLTVIALIYVSLIFKRKKDK